LLTEKFQTLCESFSTIVVEEHLVINFISQSYAKTYAKMAVSSV